MPPKKGKVKKDDFAEEPPMDDIKDKKTKGKSQKNVTDDEKFIKPADPSKGSKKDKKKETTTKKKGSESEDGAFNNVSIRKKKIYAQSDDVSSDEREVQVAKKNIKKKGKTKGVEAEDDSEVEQVSAPKQKPASKKKKEARAKNQGFSDSDEPSVPDITKFSVLSSEEELPLPVKKNKKTIKKGGKKDDVPTDDDLSLEVDDKPIVDSKSKTKPGDKKDENSSKNVIKEVTIDLNDEHSNARVLDQTYVVPPKHHMITRSQLQEAQSIIDINPITEQLENLKVNANAEVKKGINHYKSHRLT